MKIISYQPLIYLALIISSQASCDLQGHGGVSNNILESKRRNIFFAEYEVKPNPYIINDTLKIKVTDSWVENQWSYGKSESETIINKGEYQLIIEIDPGVLQNYGVTWTIGIDGDRYIRSCGSNCLMSDFNQLPKDMEEWKVQNGWKLDSISKKTIIGSFRVYKKNS